MQRRNVGLAESQLETLVATVLEPEVATKEPESALSNERNK